MITIVNLMGFPVVVAGVTIPADGRRARAESIVQKPIYLETNHGMLPMSSAETVSIDRCFVDAPGIPASPFPPAQPGTVYLAPMPVQMAAVDAGREDVWGLGDFIAMSGRGLGVASLRRI